MSDETPAAPSSPPARTAFLLGLGGILMPCAGALAEWVALALQPRGPEAPPTQRRWTGRLLGLCLVDTLIVALMVAAVAKVGTAGLTSRGTPAQATPARAVIGITVAPGPTGDGVRVAGVQPDSPAARAGLQQDDVVRTCEGAPTPTREALVDCLSAHPPGSTLRLALLRGGSEVQAQVETRAAPVLPVRPGEAPRWEPLVGAALLAALAALGSWRARAREALAATGVLGLILVGVPPLQLLAMERLPAPWSLLPLSFVGLALLAGALWVRRVTRSPAPPLWSASSDWRHVLGLALWVHFTGLLRLAAVIGLMLLLLGRESALVATPIEGLVAAQVRGPVAITLFLLIAVVLAPLAEEAFFRGVVLEGLLAWMRPVPAVAATAAVFALMHGGYGLRALLIFFIGCVLGWARLRSGGLRVPILVHGTQNLVSGVLMVLLARG